MDCDVSTCVLQAEMRVYQPVARGLSNESRQLCFRHGVGWISKHVEEKETLYVPSPTCLMLACRDPHVAVGLCGDHLRRATSSSAILRAIVRDKGILLPPQAEAADEEEKETPSPASPSRTRSASSRAKSPPSSPTVKKVASPKSPKPAPPRRVWREEPTPVSKSKKSAATPSPPMPPTLAEFLLDPPRTTNGRIAWSVDTVALLRRDDLQDGITRCILPMCPEQPKSGGLCKAHYSYLYYRKALRFLPPRPAAGFRVDEIPPVEPVVEPLPGSEVPPLEPVVEPVLGSEAPPLEPVVEFVPRSEVVRAGSKADAEDIAIVAAASAYAGPGGRMVYTRQDKGLVNVRYEPSEGKVIRGDLVEPVPGREFPPVESVEEPPVEVQDEPAAVEGARLDGPVVADPPPPLLSSATDAAEEAACLKCGVDVDVGNGWCHGHPVRTQDEMARIRTEIDVEPPRNTRDARVGESSRNGYVQAMQHVHDKAKRPSDLDAAKAVEPAGNETRTLQGAAEMALELTLRIAEGEQVDEASWMAMGELLSEVLYPDDPRMRPSWRRLSSLRLTRWQARSG